MLKLPHITLIGFDSIHPEKTLAALKYSMRQAQFARVVFVGDSKNGWVTKRCSDWGMEFVHGPTTTRADHEWFVLEKIPTFFKTRFCLFSEWDAAVANPAAWTDDFLNYDYIGAPWPYGSVEERWWEKMYRPTGQGAPVTTERNNVGNGGFSLRSKKFCELVSKKVNRRNPHQLCSDAWMARTLRPELEKQDIKFAPETVAARFSCEDAIYTGQFGFHGDNTIRFNNWHWPPDWF
jgi:hypothetical protein